MTAKTTAKNIRTDLRNAFPSHKFSVTTHRGGQFDAIQVEWIDGPARSSVEAVANVHATENTFVFFAN